MRSKPVRRGRLEDPCAACRRDILGLLDGVACTQHRHPHHRVCAEQAGVCAVAGCGAIVFRPLGEEPESRPVPVQPAAPRPDSRQIVPLPPTHPVVIPPRWDGRTVYCPVCHGVSPWPIDSCAYCDENLVELAVRDPG